MKKIKIKTLYLISVISIGLIVLGIKSTYAIFTTTAEINNPITLNTILNNESNIIETVNVKVSAGELKTITLTINNTDSQSLNYATWYASEASNIKSGVNLSNEDSSPSSGTISSGTTKVIYVQIRNEEKEEIEVTIGVSSRKNNIVLSKPMVLVENTELYYTLGEHITNLYTKAEKTTVTQSITYNVASSVGLMNDRLGSGQVDIDSGNIRYYGASPNNYIYFNCSDYDNQTSDTCEIWRIIGVFNNKVKIMRNDSIGSIAWSQNKNTTGTSGYSNDWTTSSLQELLNEKYYYGDTSGIVTYYSGTRGTTSTSLNMTSLGIKNEETRTLIENSLWTLGGYSSYSIYTNSAYAYERGTTVYTGRPTIWNGNIALPYPSDYGYAADLSKCSNLTLYNYSSTASSYQCRANDWMYNGVAQWFLMPSSSSASYLYYVTAASRITNTAYAYSNYAVRPTAYLIEESYLIGGEGTNTSPYQLKKPPKQKLTDKITNLYNNATKTTVTSNNIEYNTSPSVGLMNDRLGGASLDSGNIRYYGTSPNNYIYFNCSDYSNQTSDTCEIWRIIGVFDVKTPTENGEYKAEKKAKIVRNESVGELSRDYKKNSNANITWEDVSSVKTSNNWSTSSLQALLNNEYYNRENLTSVIYYSSTQNIPGIGGDETEVNFNLETLGIKNDTTRNLISNTIWNLGSVFQTSDKPYANDVYLNERSNVVYEGNPTTWTGKIALYYPSDYAYAADLEKCSDLPVEDYYNTDTEDTTCVNSDWLFNSTNQWLLSPGSKSHSSNSTYVSSYGYAGNTYATTIYSFNIRPTLYLAPNITIESGNGTSTNPYKLSVN